MRGSLLTHRVKPEHLQEFIEAYRRFAQAATGTHGCLRYDVMQDTEDPTIIFAHVVMSDEAERGAHYNSEAAKEWRAVSQDWSLRSASDAAPAKHRHSISYIHPAPDNQR